MRATVRPPAVTMNKAAAEPPGHPLRRVVAGRALPEPARRGFPRLLDGRRVRGARVAEARHLRAELGRRGARRAVPVPGREGRRIGHDESDGSESDYPYSDYDADSVHEHPSASAEHQLLHEEWEHTWHTWLCVCLH